MTKKSKRTTAAKEDAVPVGSKEAAVAEPTPKDIEPTVKEEAEEEFQQPAPKSEPIRSAVRERSASSEPIRALPRLTLDVYLLAKGIKPDQTAGFRRWMKDRKVRRQTMPEWEVLWNEFQARPVTNRR